MLKYVLWNNQFCIADLFEKNAFELTYPVTNIITFDIKDFEFIKCLKGNYNTDSDIS